MRKKPPSGGLFVWPLLLLAQSGGWRAGSTSALPEYFKHQLFRYGQGVIDFDAEIPDRVFDLL
jgi:hypothetical protein